jgi:anti-sigma regulatory factor (Ser/Thr protein kinase)
VTQTRAFRCQPEAVAAARGFVRHALRHQQQQTVDAAELMASEVVTNCVRHARTDFELTIFSRGQIRIEVRDSGQGRPTPLSPSSRELSGRGLRIVEAMSDDWGVIPASSGKTVWFTVPQHDAASEASSAADSAERAASRPKSSDVVSESRIRNMFAIPRTSARSPWNGSLWTATRIPRSRRGDANPGSLHYAGDGARRDQARRTHCARYAHKTLEGAAHVQRSDPGRGTPLCSRARLRF